MSAVLLLLAGLAVQEPVRVSASLSRDEIHAGEITVLRVEARTDGARAQIERLVRLPPGVELVSTRDFDQRQFSMPGGTRRFVSREFVLRALSSGQYRIPSVDVVVEGRAYATRSLVLTVLSPRGGAGANGRGGPHEEVDLRAWLDTDTAYVGQQVTMHAEAMFSQTARLRLRRAPEYEPPSPSGFWLHDLPDRRTASSRVVGNEVYEVQTFRRAFFPISPGEYEIEPARLEYEMRRGILYAPETFEARSDPLPLVVLPVPAEGRPPEFTGAVGEYTVRGRIEPAEVPVGEAAVLTVEVEGRGNIKALPPPRLPELEAMEVFPPSEDAETRIVDREVRGRKTFSWVIIPRAAGEHEIPAIRYPYFDPEEGEFELAEVAPLPLRATPGDGLAPAAPRPERLRYLKTEPQRTAPLGWVRSPWFALAQLVPLLALALGVAAGRERTGLSRRELRRRRKAGVRALQRRVENADPGFFSDAESFLRRWLADRLAARPAEVASRSTLASRGVGEGTAAAIVSLFDRLTAARYAPAPPPAGARREMARALGQLLERVDREAPMPRAERPRARAGATVGIIVLGLAAGARPANGEGPGYADGRPPGQEPAEAFRAGLDAFGDGRFDEAAAAFDRYVDRRPEDPAGWYNLGTAYQRAGHPGYAIWAWLHVPPLAPRDADTRHNLRVAGAAPELVRRVSPPLRLRFEELALLASAAWMIAGLAGALWLARRRRGPGVAAVVAILVALGLAFALIFSTRGPRTVIVLENSTLRAGPALRGDPLTELDPGAGLVPVSSYGDWLRVRTLDGQEGWIDSRAVGRL